MAMACFRFFALGCRPFPAFSVPRFARETALRTDRLATRPYLRFVPDFVDVLFLRME